MSTSVSTILLNPLVMEKFIVSKKGRKILLQQKKKRHWINLLPWKPFSVLQVLDFQA